MTTLQDVCLMQVYEWQDISISFDNFAVKVLTIPE